MTHTYQSLDLDTVFTKIIDFIPIYDYLTEEDINDCLYMANHILKIARYGDDEDQSKWYITERLIYARMMDAYLGGPVTNQQFKKCLSLLSPKNKKMSFDLIYQKLIPNARGAFSFSNVFNVMYGEIIGDEIPEVYPMYFKSISIRGKNGLEVKTNIPTKSFLPACHAININGIANGRFICYSEDGHKKVDLCIAEKSKDECYIVDINKIAAVDDAMKMDRDSMKLIENYKMMGYRPFSRPKNFMLDFAFHQGTRNYMEDRFYFARVLSNIWVFAIFDGHGGFAVSDYLKNVVHDIAAKHASKICRSTKKTLEKTMDDFFSALAATMPDELARQAGSTASIAFYNEDTSEYFLGYLGDSSVCHFKEINGNTIGTLLTNDHNVNNMEEVRRLRDMQFYPLGGHFIYSGEGAGLAVSRAFGDKQVPFIITTPSVEMGKLDLGDILVLASDGLWDSFLLRNIKAKNKSMEKFKNEYASNLIDYSHGGDNISCIKIVRTK